MKKIFYMGKEYAGFTDNAMDMTNPKIDLASYGTSPTSGGTTTKVVTTNGGNFERVNGAYVVVTFANANTGSVSLNVDGTGSKYAYYNGSRLNASNGNFSAGETVTFMYDGTYYQRLDADTDDTSILKSLANLGWSDVLSSGILIVKKLITKVMNSLVGLLYSSDDTVYLDYCKARRRGNVVNIWGESSGGWNIPASSYASLTTLPEQFRPDRVVYDCVEAYGGTSHISIIIQPNGLVQLYCPNSIAWWRYNVTYIIA